MECPNCLAVYHDSEDDWVWAEFGPVVKEATFSLQAAICPACRTPIVILTVVDPLTGAMRNRITVYPNATTQSVQPSKLPQAIHEYLRVDYSEACNVLPISAKASATLSRRILQSILTEQGYDHRDLAKQIEDVLQESDPTKILPNYLRPVIDAVRNFGNFSAHQITDATTLQVIDVEPEEAEYCISIIDALFDHYYIRPADNAKMLADLNRKLQHAGKPASKN